MDWDALGLLDGAADAAVRRALLDHLDDRGYPLELLQDAHRQGRLYALAGDQVIRPGRVTVTLPELARRLDADPDWLRRLWRALGLSDPGPDVPAATEDEVEAFAVWPLIRSALGDEASLSLARVHGASLARISEAVAAAFSSVQPDLDLLHTGDELATASAYESVAALVPQVTRLVDVLYRQHLGEATRYFESAHAPAGFGMHGVPYCVAFADLCGFTAATERLSTTELTALLGVFENAAYDEAAARGARCVKLIGDAAMIVCPSPDGLVEVAHRVVARMAEENALLPVRVGMAAGTVVVRDGDYFGAPVNLAARLLGLAEPGAVLADAALVARLDASRWDADAQEPRLVKGVGEQVVPYRVRPQAAVAT